MILLLRRRQRERDRERDREYEREREYERVTFFFGRQPDVLPKLRILLRDLSLSFPADQESVVCSEMTDAIESDDTQRRIMSRGMIIVDVC